MRHVLGVFWAAVKDLWEELFMLALMNLVTMLLLVPVVTFPPALAGLWNVANIAVQGKSIAWSDYWEAFKRYFGKAWKLAGLNIAVLATLFVNMRFYTPGVAPFNISDNLSFVIRAIWFSLTVLWVMLQMYTLAMLLEQTDQRVRLALRNSAVLLFANPGFSFILFLLLLVVSAVSTVIPALWALISLALLAVVCNKAVRHLLVPYRERLAQEQAAQAEEATTQAEDPEDAESEDE
jgi:uncharacterized membrane protein YesL